MKYGKSETSCNSCPPKIMRLFIAKVKNLSENEIVFHMNDLQFSPNEIAQLEDFVSRYESHEPVSKILNRREFWNSEFFVNKDVLDPRPETEIIVEQTLKIFAKDQAFEFLDIGTGSGCILLSIAQEFPKSFGVGIDISEKAVAVALKNKSDLRVKNVEIQNVSWNDFVPQKKFDLIVSNPPYIKNADIWALDDNVKNFDPHIALDGGKDGLVSYDQLSKLLGNWLKPSGKILLEVGFDQHDAVKNIFESKGFVLKNTFRDLQQIPRILEFILKNPS
ncbi:MAG: peptide chain release factor N(5)-glutamine methyltransferase [Alphaproteobacteria bacterium]|nr:peptide chain release factor N(5)-glutamine methyltransferase [Alphaproteobacteria bacterium]